MFDILWDYPEIQRPHAWLRQAFLVAQSARRVPPDVGTWAQGGATAARL